MFSRSHEFRREAGVRYLTEFDRRARHARRMWCRLAIGALAVAACSPTGGGRDGDRDGGIGDSSAVDASGSDGNEVPACPGARPDATNTGVPASVTLTVVDHDVVVTSDSTVIDAQD